MWYHEHIGGGRCPIVDTWWQTETGGIMISPLPGATTTKPGSATFPLPGHRRPSWSTTTASVVDARRRLPHADPAVAGHAARHLGRPRALPGDVLEPVPGPLLRRRRRQARRRRLPLAARPGRRRDERVAATASRPPRSSRRWCRIPRSPRPRSSAPTTPTTGQAIIAYVTLRGGADVDRRRRCATTSPRRSGRSPSRRRSSSPPICPKTRSGKIMRRLLRDVAEGRNLGDTTTLADAGVVDELQRRANEAPPED